MSNPNSNIKTGSHGGIDLHQIQSFSIRSFLNKTSNTEQETQKSPSSAAYPSSTDTSSQNDVPSLDEIMYRIPRKEFLKPICNTPGIFLLANYIFSEQEKSQLFCNLHSEDPVDITDHLYRRLISSSDSTIQKAKEEYFEAFADRSSLVLTAITECAPLVIAAHRTHIERVGYALCQNGTYPAPDIDGLLRIPYIDMKRLLQNPSFLSSADHSPSQDLTNMRLDLLREIDLFRSSNYSLAPYFDTELHLLAETNKKHFQKALEILERTVQERNGIAPLGSKGIRTKKPISYIKQMSYLTRQVFDRMPPCDLTHVYNRSNISSKGSQSNHSPILSLHTWNDEPLTRAHGEVYDAVCTLWLAGNKAVTDQMIARTIWPRMTRNGGETFSEKELDTINTLMNDLRHTYVTIEASAELRKYKKIGKDDCWQISNFALPCSVIYQTINGGQYPHRAYQLLDTPVFLAYSAALTQVFTIPIVLLCPPKTERCRNLRSLRAAQVRSLLLERLHHFRSPSYRKKERTILYDRIYEAYGVDEATPNRQKKERLAARKAANYVLQTFEQAGLIKHYEIIKHSGAYHCIKIDL